MRCDFCGEPIDPELEGGYWEHYANNRLRHEECLLPEEQQADTDWQWEEPEE